MEQDKILNLKFPIVSLKGNILYFARNWDEISTCSRTGLKSGFYNNLSIIDSNGTEYKIKRANKSGYAGPFWGLNIFYGQRLKVELVLKDTYKNVLEDLKSKIVKILKNEKHFWDSDGEIETKFNFIQNAKNHSELISYLSDFFYKHH